MPSPSAETLDTIAAVHRAYSSLMRYAIDDAERGLGGQLLYAGELDTLNRHFVIGANIAGCATLTASADGAALRHAMREGAIDFLVNSLDEALRILKNEVRKRQPVAVAVSLEPATIEGDMLERGVLPNLLAPISDSRSDSDVLRQFTLQGARQVKLAELTAEKLLVWVAPAEYAQNLAAFDAMIADHLAPEDNLNRRWLRLSPGYLGPAARRLRSVSCNRATAIKLIETLGQPMNA